MDAEQPSAVGSSHLDPASRRVGTVLDGKWTLNRLLGVGGMAAVYAGTHRNGARAAIKLFPFSVTTSAEFAERILREGYLANKIGHPAVVRVLDDHLDREREYAYLVMELLEGETARQRVERTGPMSPLEAARSMIELADCLAAAHDKGVVHRDIKPENLFLTQDGKLKVLDFGVARALDGTSSSVTRTGTTLGTPAYMSPEQARGRPSEVSARSDLYSVGATLLFLVAGEFLHEGESAQEIMVRAAWTPARKIGERHLGLPQVLADVIDRACEFEPSARYPSASDLRVDLEKVLVTLAGDPTAAEPVARISKMPVRGPISTAPLPLNRPSSQSAAELTVADRTHEPLVGATSTTTLTKRNRRAPWWIAGSLATAALVGGTIFWPHRPPLPDASPASDGDRSRVGAPSSRPEAAAPAPTPAVSVPTVASGAVEAPPSEPKSDRSMARAPRPHPSSVAHAHAASPVVVTTPASPSAKVAPRATASGSSKSAPIGRDVGY